MSYSAAGFALNQLSQAAIDLLPVAIFVIVGVGLVISFMVFRRIIRFFRQVANSVRGWVAPATS